MKYEGLTMLNGERAWQVYFRQREDKPNNTRAYTCLQIGVWDTCSDVINDVFGNADTDALFQVIQLTPEYAGKQLRDANLDNILTGMAEPQCLDSLCVDIQHTLLKAFQNAIRMQSKMLITASNLAQTLDCPLEYVEEAIRGYCASRKSRNV